MNEAYGKLDENGMMRYAPDAVRVVEHHTSTREEYAEYDEEGNGVGEPTVVTDEWDTERTAFPPTAEDYRNAKLGPYLPNEDTQPDVPDGKRISSQAWASDGEKNYKVFEYEDVEPAHEPVYTLSKLKCYTALQQMKVTVGGEERVAWDVVQSWLEENGLWTAFVLANEVRTDHPMFVQGFATFRTMLGLTDEQAQAFIQNCVME